MKKFVVVWLVILQLFSIAAAQSGRKIEATPTPTPAQVSQENTEKDYSESSPVKTRPTTTTTLRNIPTDSKPQTQASTVQKDSAATDNGDDVLKIETNLITIPVSVFDRNGLYIPSLAQENFKIFEDGKEQEIAYFGTTEQPFTVVLLLDTSLSFDHIIKDIKTAAIAFVDQLKPQDSVMVIEFAWNINVLSELTTDRQKIYKGIKKADMDEGTSIYDAVNHALRKRLSGIKGKKAIVLFTDGVDTTSDAATYDSTLKLAEESDVTIFPIYYDTYLDNKQNASIYGTINGTSKNEYLLGKRYIEDLAAVTGGRVYTAESNAVNLTRTFESIAEELRRQYNIGYYPQEVGENGQRKQIRVRVNRPNLVVRARDSYIVGGNTSVQTTTPVKTQ
jgi:Ca-activated chloride channel family protein